MLLHLHHQSSSLYQMHISHACCFLDVIRDIMLVSFIQRQAAPRYLSKLCGRDKPLCPLNAKLLAAKTDIFVIVASA